MWQVANVLDNAGLNQSHVGIILTSDQNMFLLCRGQTFENGRSTIATVGTICAGKAVGISVDINVFEPHILAANLAHAIGHNLGFHHDSMEGKPGKLFYFKPSCCRAFHGFGQAKFPNGGLVLGSSQFSILPQLPQKTMLGLKGVKIDPQ